MQFTSWTYAWEPNRETKCNMKELPDVLKKQGQKIFINKVSRSSFYWIRQFSVKFFLEYFIAWLTLGTWHWCRSLLRNGWNSSTSTSKLTWKSPRHFFRILFSIIFHSTDKSYLNAKGNWNVILARILDVAMRLFNSVGRGNAETSPPPEIGKIEVEIWCYLLEVYTFGEEAEIQEIFRKKLWKRSIFHRDFDQKI